MAHTRGGGSGDGAEGGVKDVVFPLPSANGPRPLLLLLSMARLFSPDWAVPLSSSSMTACPESSAKRLQLK